ncbi:unnamed protein product [Acanthocheilonema viteae]|uniref:Uncharacterized protein n=1 Tax=Acanthocheilonema viteae TaxID=6277 RepID=A0A498STI4_ACAVI|nr:unnamed protein product [Acanthocheilonema viteae]
MSSGFYLVHTKVGPIKTGCGCTNMTCKFDSLNSINVSTIITNPDIDQFWKLEIIEIQEQPNEDDKKALEQFKNSITKENNRYQVCWPWKDSKVSLLDNYGLCYGRLKTLVKRLQTNQSLLERYDETIKEQLRSNVIEKVTANMDQEGIIHYLPHHEIWNKDLKTLAKFLAVADAEYPLIANKTGVNVFRYSSFGEDNIESNAMSNSVIKS